MRENMKEKITKMKQGEGLNQDKTDWKRLDAMTDEDIDYSDIPEFDEKFLESVEMKFSPEKK